MSIPNTGLTPAGYVPTTAQQETDNLGQLVLQNVAPSLDLDPAKPLGQVLSQFGGKFAEITSTLAAVYQAIDPNNARGQALANVCAATGTLPQVATYSTVVCSLTLNANTTVRAGATAIVQGQPSNTWVLVADAVNSTNAQAVLPATFRSQQPGPQQAPAGTLTVIGTPTIGWTIVTNPADAVQGLAADTDTSLRNKREEELLGQGSGDIAAIRAAVLKVGHVQACFVYENNTTQGDPASGMPPKSFEVVIWDGAGMAASNNDVATAIYENKPGGIMPYGVNASGTAVDSAGVSHVVPFNRAQSLGVYISITVNATLSATQITNIKTALGNFANQYWGLGIKVVWGTLFGIIYSVLGPPPANGEITSLTLGTAPSPTGTSDIPVSGLQIATLASGGVLVNGQ